MSPKLSLVDVLLELIDRLRGVRDPHLLHLELASRPLGAGTRRAPDPPGSAPATR